MEPRQGAPEQAVQSLAACNVAPGAYTGWLSGMKCGRAREAWQGFRLYGGDLASTAVMKPEVHAERVGTLANQFLHSSIFANDENYALAA